MTLSLFTKLSLKHIHDHSVNKVYHTYGLLQVHSVFFHGCLGIDFIFFLVYLSGSKTKNPVTWTGQETPGTPLVTLLSFARRGLWESMFFENMWYEIPSNPSRPIFADESLFYVQTRCTIRLLLWVFSPLYFTVTFEPQNKEYLFWVNVSEDIFF